MDEVTGVSGTSQTQQTAAAGKTASTSPKTSTPSNKSTMSPAEQEKEQSKEPSMGAPVLMPPLVAYNDVSNFIAIAGLAVANSAMVSKTQNANEFIAGVQIQMLQTTNDALSKWVQSLQDISVENTKAQNIKRNNDMQTEKTEENLQAGKDNADKARAVGEQSLIFSGLLLSGLVPGIASISASTMVPITQAVTALAATTGVQAIPAAFFSLVSVMASGVLMQAARQTLFSGAKDKGVIREDFVKNYSAKILTTINDESFDSTLAKLFPDKANMIPTAKLILLATALGLSYKAETGHIIGPDFLNMVNGTIILSPNDPRLALIAAFQSTLKDLGDKGDEMKEKLASYFDSNPSLDSLLEPSDAIAGFLSGQFVSPVIGG